MLETVLRSLMYRAVLYEVDYYFRARVIQMKMWIFYEPSERVDTRWRKSFQIKCTSTIVRRSLKIWRFLLRLKLISILFWFLFYISIYATSRGIAVASDAILSMWVRTKIPGVVCTVCGIVSLVKISRFSLQKTAKKPIISTSSLFFSLFLSPLPQSLRYFRLSLILPSCTLSLLLSPPRVRVTAVFRSS